MSPHHDDREGVCRANGSRPESAPAARDFVAARSLKRQLLAELRASWDEGQPIPPEDLLSRWPDNPEADPDVASLLSEDYWQRRRQGQQPTSEQYHCRFPGQEDSLTGLLEHQALLRSCGEMGTPSSRLLALPAAGDELFGFQLRHELGRGSYARVFLAVQKTLADRPVVVKVSAIDGDEPQTLAQLQHTHIVPIYSVHEDCAAGLRVVCMPYFGGASLARVLQGLGADTSLPTHGKQLVEALSVVRSPWSPAEAAQTIERGPLAVLAHLPYVNAAAWIIARLAEALQHAHQRGIFHRDVKPSNILLNADGQPMLLDFNLAENFQANQVLAVATVGGTVAYMAPEHLRALATRDPALARQVDHRADLYGLGMVFYELLTGSSPFGQNAGYSPLPDLVAERSRFVPSLRRHRSDAPWNLESITRKCLDPNPAKRYQQAEHLAEDLRRYLEDRPLKYAAELSWRERMAKWRRRHPRLAVNGLLAVAAAILLAAGWTVLSSALTRAHEGGRAIAQQTMQSFRSDAQQARCFLNAIIGERAPIQEGIEICETALGHYHVLQAEDWRKQAVWQRLQQEEQKQLAEQIRELLVLLARARIMRAPVEAGRRPCTPAAAPALIGWTGLPVNCLASAAAATSQALENGLELLDRAYAIGDPQTSRTIREDRAFYLELLGRGDEARAVREEAKKMRPTPRDHYLLGSSYAYSGRFPEAITELKQALRFNTSDYWSHFHLGMCYRQQSGYVLAASEFRACTALWSGFSWGHFNLGEALQQLGKSAEAIAEYSAAIEYTPAIPQAYYNRGLVYLNLSQWQQALDDFDQASQGGCSEDVLHCARGIALAHLGYDDEAKAALAKALARGWKNVEMLLGYAFVIYKSRPEEAQDIFQRVLERDPENERALYGCGMLLENQRRDSEEAATLFTRAIQVNSTFVEPRLARAIVLAHQGKGGRAREDIDLCLQLKPTGQTYYGAACFYALLSAKRADVLAAWWAGRALQLLGEAFKRGYGCDVAATDSDLDSLRRYRKFTELLERATKPEDSR